CWRAQLWPDRVLHTAATSPGIAGVTLSVGDLLRKRIRKMWPVAILLMAVTLFYWFSFCITVIAWLKALAHLCFGNFVRATIWFSVGCGMLFWWMGTDIDFDTWLRGSAVIVGIGALGTFAGYHRKRKAMLAMPTMPMWTMPVEVSGNIVPFVKVTTKVEREH